MSVNKVILVGRLGRDPETRYTGGGQAVANFSMATDESYKDKNGERQKRTEWHKIVVWGKQAEIAQQYLKKGSLIFVEGRIQLSPATSACWVAAPKALQLAEVAAQQHVPAATTWKATSRPPTILTEVAPLPAAARRFPTKIFRSKQNRGSAQRIQRNLREQKEEKRDGNEAFSQSSCIRAFSLRTRISPSEGALRCANNFSGG